MKLPTQLADAIERVTTQFDGKTLSQAAIQISRSYRCGETARSSHISLSSAEHRAAYLVTRLPATYAAVSAVLQELRQRMAEFQPVNLLDLGAGPGTAAWAACEIFPSLIRVTYVENNSALLALGKTLAAGAEHPALSAAKWKLADLTAWVPEEPSDLAVLAYALGELPEKQRESVLERTWKHGATALVIVEPGTPRGFATVLAAREQLLRLKAHIAAPCPHELACPMSGSEQDWCHFAQRLERSSLHRRLKSGSMGYEDEKFSYIIAVRNPAKHAAARIVRHPIQRKGHIQLELCAREGLTQITVPRSQQDAFKKARKAKWGEEWGSDSH